MASIGLFLIAVTVVNYFVAADSLIELSLERTSNQIRSLELPQTHRNISILDDEFVLDGSPIRIVSGSLHYFRAPAAYWRDRLRTLKAAGLNTVSTYVEWSYHEPEERQYAFTGDKDVARFIQIAGEEGLHVLLRPGPYICGERDLGGLPYWLLGKYPDIKLRTTDKDFINETRIWFEQLFTKLKPLLYGNGGPIILVQVENEYGSYGNDKVYMGQLRDIIQEHVSNNALLYTTDGSAPSYYMKGSISGAVTTIDFGTGSDVKQLLRTFRQYVPTGPLMNSEYYPGWLTHWGEPMASVSTNSVIMTLRDMLNNGVNVNFYMFFGGSNFEFTAGANYFGTYQSDITSYDYDAPMTEAGDPTPKYLAIRQYLEQYNPAVRNIAVPTPSSKGSYGNITVVPRVQLLSSSGRSLLGKSYNDVTGPNLPTFEELRQRAGFILYETTLNEDDGLLEIGKPRDIVYVYVDEEFQGVVNRMYKIYSVPIRCKPGSKLSLLVENQGRVNFGPQIHDRKGILSAVKLNNKALRGKWSLTGYPLETITGTQQLVTLEGNLEGRGPIIYDGHFTLPAGETPKDTYIDTTGWVKGYVWINGHNLGRYWPGLGPQVTLYVPGVWLKAAPATNNIQVLELKKAATGDTILSIDYAILNRVGYYNL